jgi:hypothetical protein
MINEILHNVAMILLIVTFTKFIIKKPKTEI